MRHTEGVCAPDNHREPEKTLRTKKVKLPDGREIEGEIMPFQSGGEHWNEYLVEDGTVIKIKLVASEVVRLNGEYDQAGNPVYIVQSTNVLSVSVPDELLKEEP